MLNKVKLTSVEGKTYVTMEREQFLKLANLYLLHCEGFYKRELAEIEARSKRKQDIQDSIDQLKKELEKLGGS